MTKQSIGYYPIKQRTRLLRSACMVLFDPFWETKKGRGGGTSLRICGVLLTDIARPLPPTLTVDEESSSVDCRFKCKLTAVCIHPDIFNFTVEIKFMPAPLIIGADVAKNEIVFACSADTFTPCSVTNDTRALTTWLRTLPKESRIGMEATSSYHECLARLAHRFGHIVFVLNPKDTRYYAKGIGQRGKTDRVDAKLLARFVAHEQSHLRPWQPPTPLQKQIDGLIKRRAKLTALKTTLTLSMKGVRSLTNDVKTLTDQLNALLLKIDRQLVQLISTHSSTHQTCQRLQTIVGVGQLVGAGLTNTLERVPFKNADAFVAFIGYDPRPCDSGQKRGRRRLSKRGPSELRRLLFNAAMSAAKTKLWRPIYDHYRSKGWATTAVLVIIARKIARIAWSLHHYQTTFDPLRLQKT